MRVAQVAPLAESEGERTEGWLAICHLWSSVKENTGADVDGLWENAIDDRNRGGRCRGAQPTEQR